MRVRMGRLGAAVTGLVLGVGAPGMSVPMEPGPVSGGKISRALPAGTSANPGSLEEFLPDRCAGEPPPAELLALAAWPLDANGSGCAGISTVAFEPAVVELRHVAVVERPVPSRRAAVAERPAGQESGVVRTVSRGLQRADVEVIERSWTSRGDGVADGTVVINAVRPADEPLVLAQVVERGWVRDEFEQTASACDSTRADIAGPGRCVVVDRKIASLESMPVDGYDAELEHDDRPLVIAGTVPVDDDVMAGVRGGFVTPAGLTMSFGIERVVYINGALSSTTTLNVVDLGQIIGGSADMAKTVPIGTTVGLIQSGPNNTFVGDVMSSGAFATVIQNSIDNQHIQTVTTINTQVNSLEMMRAHRLGESLRDALTFR